MDSQLPEGFRLLMIIFAGALLGCELIQFVLGLDTDQFIDDFFVLAVALYALVAGMLGRLPGVALVIKDTSQT